MFYRFRVHFLYISLLGLTVGALFPACTSVKPMSELKTDKPVIKEKPEVYLKRTLIYKTFHGKAEAQINTPDINQKVNIHFNMNKDIDLMASVRALGMLEVAKAYATPDSVYALNRMNKTGYILGYNEGTELLKTDIPFPSLQNLIVGNLLIPENSTIVDVKSNDSIIVITQKNDDFQQTTHFDLETHLLKTLHLKANKQPFTCTITYKKYEKIGVGQLFPYQRKIEINNNGDISSADLNFYQATINQSVNTNFSIPGSYKILKKIN